MCRGLRQAGTQRRARRDDLRSDLRVLVGDQVAKTNALEIAAAPALIVGEIIPFADDRAYRSRRRSGGAKRKIVGKVEEMTRRPIGRRQVPLQPKQFWNFHFRGDRAADIAQDLVLRLVHLALFDHRAMIHPNDDVPSVVAGVTYRQRMGASVEHHERAGRVKPQTLDRGSRNGCLRHRGANRSSAC